MANKKMKPLTIEQRDALWREFDTVYLDLDDGVLNAEEYFEFIDANTEESKPVKKTVLCFEGEEFEMKPLKNKCPECGGKVGEHKLSCPQGR